MRVLTTLLLALLIAIPAGAQVVSDELAFERGAEDLPIRFENITLEDGLSQSSVYAIHQDRKGFMWFGTQIGLNRYDGHQIVQHLPDPFDSTSVLNSYIEAIAERPDGKMWLGYRDGSVSLFDPSSGRAQNFQSSDTDSTRLETNRMFGLYPEERGSVLISGRSLQRLDETGTVEIIKAPPEEDGWDAFNPGLVQMDDGGLLVAQGPSIGYLDAQTQVFEVLFESPVPVWLPVRDPHDADLVWWASPEGLVKADLRAREAEVFRVSDGENRFVQFARPDPGEPGVVWVSTDMGISRVDSNTGSYFVYRSRAGESAVNADTDLLANSVGPIYADRSGILWASAWGAGVSRFDPTAIGFARDASSPNDPNAMRGESVWTILPESNGVVWAVAEGSGTSDPGWYLNRIDRRSGEVRYWKTRTHSGAALVKTSNGTILFGSGNNWDEDPELQTGGVLRYNPLRNDMEPLYTEANGMLPLDNVWDIMIDSRERIWVGVNEAVVRIDPQSGERRLWEADDSSSTALRDRRVRDIFEDSRGDVWVSAFRDLVRIPGGESQDVERFHDRDDMPENSAVARPRYMLEDSRGHVWWGMQPQGEASWVQRYDPERDEVINYFHDITDRTTWSGGTISGIVASEDDPDIIYFTTYGAGLSKLDLATGEFRHYRPEDGLTNQSAYQALIDSEGMVWVPTNSGLFEFNPETETFRRFGLEYGLQSLEFNGSSIARSASGELFFGGVKGFNAFFPSQLRSNDTPPDVAITEFLLFNEQVVPGPDSPLKRSISDTEELRLAHDQDAPAFRFAALHYKRPESNLIRYRLDPQDEDWVDADGRNEAAYTNLKPGEYTFRVIAANSDGVWNAEGKSLRLIITPPWWTRWWAYLMYIGLLAVAVMGVDRYQRARIARRQREENRERELEHAKEVEVAYNELRETKQQLVEQEKLASLGSLTAGIAHEIKNPLNFVNNFAEVNAELAQELADAVASGDNDEAQSILADLLQNAHQIAKHGKRADGIVRAMMQHARGGSGERETVEVNEFIGEYVNLAWHGMRAQDHNFTAEVKRDFAEDVGSLSAQPQDLGRVILNLLNNAFYAVQDQAGKAPEGYKPVVQVSTKRIGNDVEIRVSDNGPGIPPDVRAKIFEPFFTTKPTGQGTGLGLSLSYDIVTKGHGGRMELQDSASGGAEFVITVPAGA